MGDGRRPAAPTLPRGTSGVGVSDFKAEFIVALHHTFETNAVSAAECTHPCFICRFDKSTEYDRRWLGHLHWGVCIRWSERQHNSPFLFIAPLVALQQANVDAKEIVVIGNITPCEVSGRVRQFFPIENRITRP